MRGQRTTGKIQRSLHSVKVCICIKGEFRPPMMEHKIHAQAIAQDQLEIVKGYFSLNDF